MIPLSYITKYFQTSNKMSGVSDPPFIETRTNTRKPIKMLAYAKNVSLVSY